MKFKIKTGDFFKFKIELEMNVIMPGINIILSEEEIKDAMKEGLIKKINWAKTDKKHISDE